MQEDPEAEEEHQGEHILCCEDVVVQNLRGPEGGDRQSCETGCPAGQHNCTAPDEKAGKNRADHIEHLTNPYRVAEDRQEDREHIAVAVDMREHGDVLAVSLAVLEKSPPADELCNLIIGLVIRAGFHREVLDVDNADDEGGNQNQGSNSPFQSCHQKRMAGRPARELEPCTDAGDEDHSEQRAADGQYDQRRIEVGIFTAGTERGNAAQQCIRAAAQI